jgi:hypothetical protein
VLYARRTLIRATKFGTHDIASNTAIAIRNTSASEMRYAVIDHFSCEKEYARHDREWSARSFQARTLSPGSKGAAGARVKRGASRHVRACRPIWLRSQGSNGDARATTQDARKVWRVRWRAAVRFQENKKPAAVASAGFKILR